MSKVYELFGLNCIHGFYVGSEFEVEGVVDYSVDQLPHLADCTEDNSLREMGREFITHPLTKKDAIDFHFNIFHGAVDFSSNVEVCNERCSTHIHVNFTDVDEDKVRQFVRLYALVEPLFFRMVNQDRQNNIYCVPISATNLLQKVGDADLGYLTDTWHKYAAFNVKPLAKFGTIEFRHFHATQDNAEYSMWLDMIEALYHFNLNITVDLLLSDSLLYRLVNAVSPTPMSRDEIYELMNDNIVNDTLLMVNPTKELLLARLKQSKETV